MSRFRLVFEELLTLETGLLYIRSGSVREGEGVSIDPEPGASPPEWQQDGAILSLSVDASAFAYRIKFAQRQSRP